MPSLKVRQTNIRDSNQMKVHKLEQAVKNPTWKTLNSLRMVKFASPSLDSHCNSSLLIIQYSRSKLTNHTFSIAEKQIAGDSFEALLFPSTQYQDILVSPSTPWVVIPGELSLRSIVNHLPPPK
ncbi:hypothetical protein CDAR_402781 [Caerostris darwini]|uniref:Uncharacterized protein n=1 Tax=Caerostris darwini TaxID=1538125 RepID=A0AAV4N3Z3_9ARAC|nr:hypothetical protein CDAR_402781 [Caerostris darwini]